MTDFVRVKQAETGHEFSIPSDAAARDQGLEVLGKPAADRFGKPLPPKYASRAPGFSAPRAAAKTPTPEKADTAERSKQ